MGYTPPFLDVRKGTGLWNVYAPSTTAGDDLQIWANSTDTTPVIIIYGGTYIHLKGASVRFGDTTERVKISFTDPDNIIEGLVADKNIFLKTAGTGVIKFGTYTAGAATDSTGYITILDAAGNTRKLMVQA